ncbi:MAG: delta-60 repeat domain-containing protein [Flavobacteriales bacterium]|nr:delta-60 repeat domain-containing protein [Flavobacteriales bacterium]
MKRRSSRLLSFVALCIGAVGGYAQPGNIDPLFNPLGAGANGTVHVVKALPDGKVLIGGAFTQYNGAPASRTSRA